jgi:hypothetical protein
MKKKLGERVLNEVPAKDLPEDRLLLQRDEIKVL